MHIIAYIYLLLKRSLPLFAQLYIAGTALIFPWGKAGKEKYITTYKADLFFHLKLGINRQNLPFRNGFLPQIKYFNRYKYWHCKISNHWQISRITRYQLPQFIQPSGMVLSGPNKARSSDPECQRLQVDTSNCLSGLFNFLTPHMRHQSSSHTDVTVLKTQPSKERINKWVYS